MALDFEETVNGAVRERFGAEREVAGRYDIAVSFNQLLTLRQMDVVGVSQSKPYDKINITKGKNFYERFR